MSTTVSSRPPIRSGLACFAMAAVLALASGCTMLSVDKRSFYKYENPSSVEDGSFRRSLDGFGNTMVGGNRVEILNNGDAIFPAMTGRSATPR